MNWSVQTSRRAMASLKKAPKHIAAKFLLWRMQVQENGLPAVQAIPSFRDEPLSGKLRGIRSVRLSNGYRAYYRVLKGDVICVLVEEVNNHDYKAIERLFGR